MIAVVIELGMAGHDWSRANSAGVVVSPGSSLWNHRLSSALLRGISESDIGRTMLWGLFDAK
jgi:hypothetical protein